MDLATSMKYFSFTPTIISDKSFKKIYEVFKKQVIREDIIFEHGREIFYQSGDKIILKKEGESFSDPWNIAKNRLCYYHADCEFKSTPRPFSIQLLYIHSVYHRRNCNVEIWCNGKCIYEKSAGENLEDILIESNTIPDVEFKYEEEHEINTSELMNYKDGDNVFIDGEEYVKWVPCEPFLPNKNGFIVVDDGSDFYIDGVYHPEDDIYEKMDSKSCVAVDYRNPDIWFMLPHCMYGIYNELKAFF